MENNYEGRCTVMVTIEQMLKEAIARNASDIFLVAGHPYAFKINGEIHSMQETRLMPNDTAQLIQEIYQYALQNSYEDFLKKRTMIFPFPYQMWDGFAAMSIYREIHRQRCYGWSALNYPIRLNCIYHRLSLRLRQ